MSDDNVTPILTRKTLGIDQLEQFDSQGVPGPGTTAEMAFAEVKRLSLKLRKRTLALETIATETEPQFLQPTDAARIAREALSDHE